MGDPSPETPDYDEPYPRIGAPDWDQSSGADFRRQVADLLREVQEQFRGGAEREREPAESFDIRPGTPFLVFKVARLLTAHLERRPLNDLVLLEIARAERALTYRLRRRFRIPGASLTGLIQRLEADGLVTRRRQERDHRHRLVSITAAGRRAATARVDRWRRADDALLQGLTPAERDELRRLLRKAATALDSRGSQ